MTMREALVHAAVWAFLTVLVVATIATVCIAVGGTGA